MADLDDYQELIRLQERQGRAIAELIQAHREELDVLHRLLRDAGKEKEAEHV